MLHCLVGKMSNTNWQARLVVRFRERKENVKFVFQICILAFSEMTERSGIEDALLAASSCGYDVSEDLSCRLTALMVPELKQLSKTIAIRLAGVTKKKGDVVERVVAMTRLGCLHHMEHNGVDVELPSSYLTKFVRTRLCSLPEFSDVVLQQDNQERFR